MAQSIGKNGTKSHLEPASSNGSLLGQFIAKDQILEFIRNRILEGQYKAGQYLSESILQRHLLEAGLAFSRVPIREALVALRAEKLVEIVPKRGTFICKITPDVITEILRARLIVEQHAARELALHPDIDLGAAQAINEEIRALPHENCSDEVWFTFTKLDGDFHCALTTLAGFGTTFTELLRTMRNRFRLILFPRDRSLHASMALKTVQEHQALLTAIRPRKRATKKAELLANACQAEAAVRTHLRHALQRWELSLADKERIRNELPDIFGGE